MSEPFLDLLHGDALCEEHRGAGVAKIVEAYFLQVMLLQKLSEVLGDEVGIVKFTECIHADVVGVFLGVRRAHHLFHLLLLLAVTEQFSSDEGLQRQRAIGRFRFQSVLGDDALLGGVDGVADGQRVLGEVDRRPLQPDHLTSPESIVSGKEDWDIDLVILGQLEQLLHFLGIVVGGDELLLPRSIGLINGVARYDTPLHRILERLMEHTVVALTGGALQPCVTKVGIELVDLIPRQILDGEVEGREELADAPVDIALVLVVGLPLDIVLMSLQPFVEVVEHLGVGKSVALTVGVCHRLCEMHVTRVILIKDLVEAILRLFFVALLGFKVQRVPLCLPLAVHARQIDHRIVFALVLCESSCDSFHNIYAPFVLEFLFEAIIRLRSFIVQRESGLYGEII